MHYAYKYALQEDSLLKCFKSYFEEKTFYCTLFLGWTLGSLAGRLDINRPESKPTAPIHHHYFFTCETEMVLCRQVYCSNCILKSVLVEVRVHTSIRNKKDSKSSGKTYSYQAVVDRGAQQLCHIFTKERPCSSTPCKYKHNCYHNNCFGAHPGYQCPRLASAGSRPSSDRENNQSGQPSQQYSCYSQ